MHQVQGSVLHQRTTSAHGVWMRGESTQGVGLRGGLLSYYGVCLYAGSMYRMSLPGSMTRARHTRSISAC